ncbi:MAG: DegT/DnrJ/EryC1/StrS family aminotransferase [Synergistaceae bacterium]|nr:DegT/DnrJ/EryC1/StrS family aminotransferase [Synergistaceae bacterium]
MLPILDLKRSWEEIKEETLTKIAEVMDSQEFILGSEVNEFEHEIESYLGGGYAIGCASGSDALVLALMALDVQPGDEVITTPFSFFATVSCITRRGATPVFADVVTDTYNIDMDEVSKKITPRTKVFLPVHMFGQMAPLETIMPELNARGIKVVEDTAQSLGSYRLLNGKKNFAGTVGDIGIFSFFPTKNLGAAGDGGMMFTRKPELGERLRKLRVHGAKKQYFHEEIGLNSRLDTLQAAILRIKFKKFEDWNKQRRELAGKYSELFKSFDLLERVSIPPESPGNYHIFHQYVIRIGGPEGVRDELYRFLNEHGIGTKIYYPLSLHLQKCFEFLGGKTGDLPKSEQLTKTVLALPIFPGLTEKEQEFVVETISAFFTKK